MAGRGSSDAVRHLLSTDDLDDALIDRTRAHFTGSTFHADLHGVVIGLVMLAPSLRTRAGFAAASARVGAAVIEVDETRHSAMQSAGESLADTLRSLAEMVDLLIVRVGHELDADWVRAEVPVPVINAGDGTNEHPTQALIDLVSIELLRGPVCELSVGISGDLGSRCVRSLLKLFERFPPRHLVLTGPDGRTEHGLDIGEPLRSRIRWSPVLDVDGLDVVYLPGLPEGSNRGRVPASVRRPYALGAGQLARLDPDAIVLSPMPVIDELDDEVRADRRTKLFDVVAIGAEVRPILLGALSVPLGPTRQPR